MTHGTPDHALIKKTDNEKGVTLMEIGIIAIIVLLCLQSGILFYKLWVRSTLILYYNIDT